MKFKNIDITWLGHSGFLIVEGSGKKIYIDPFQLDIGEVNDADIILISHPHHDHCSVEDIQKIVKKGTVVVCPADVQSKIARLEEIDLRVLDVGGGVEIGGIKILGIPAYNLNKQFHPKENNWLGYIITLSDGTRIYHAGDTDFIPEMRDLETDIALLPVSGTYVMTAEEAVDAANTFKPKIAIPMHFGDIIGDDNDAVKFGKGFKGKTVVKPVTH